MAGQRASGLALCNANLLTRITGLSAQVIVVSMKNDRHVQALVDAGRILWYQLTENDLQLDLAHR
ncbi:MAG: hypothetical protein OXC13_05050 [Caldilineaceae bacterium]|nr:hypothetical protein [Caldilineaceae bacterium]